MYRLPASYTFLRRPISRSPLRHCRYTSTPETTPLVTTHFFIQCTTTSAYEGALRLGHCSRSPITTNAHELPEMRPSVPFPSNYFHCPPPFRSLPLRSRRFKTQHCKMIVCPPGLVLVTGASGFIGAHVVVQLLEAGYRVRGTARGAKLEVLQEHFKDNSSFEAIAIDDIATADYSKALEGHLTGVDAVFHIASPIAGKALPEDSLKGAMDGTLNILCQAVSAGIYKMVITSSFATFFDPGQKDTYVDRVLTEEDWGETSRKDLLSGNHNPLYVYFGTKILTEKAVWHFAGEHPELDLTTINPPFVYGPFVLYLADSPAALGSNVLIYRLIAGLPGRPLPVQTAPYWIHVRDVARAHVLALTLPKNLSRSGGDSLERKRFMLAGPGCPLWTDMVKHIAEKHPHLRHRLPSLENAPEPPRALARHDTTRAREILGITEYISWEETVDNTVQALLEVEQVWATPA
ncbi:hypothetical protein C8Q80DRAFT_1207016 [Daedaleopsis nitida]|nr:hypothetical protein C8Q80DRAFT_1207016 [Daedaleopsis nitida]